MLSPFLSMIVLEALSREIRSGCQDELLFADDLVLVSEILEGLEKGAWKRALESKGLKGNVKKIKMMFEERV